jgi:hypothetical protein
VARAHQLPLDQARVVARSGSHPGGGKPRTDRVARL